MTGKCDTVLFREYDQTVLYGKGHQTDRIVHVQFFKYVAVVCINGADTDMQFIGNLLMRFRFCNQLNDLALAVGQVFDSIQRRKFCRMQYRLQSLFVQMRTIERVFLKDELDSVPELFQR